MNPPGQLGIEDFHTITLYIYREKGDKPPWSINHRGLAYHYTAYIYIYNESPWSIEHRGLAYHYTLYIYNYIYQKEMNPLVNQA